MPTNQNNALSRRGFLSTAGQSLLAAGALASASLAAIPLAPPDKEPDDLKIPGPMKKKLGYAIVGLGELALSQILPAFATSEKCRPVALVSGHPDKAKQVAEHYGIDAKNIYGYDNFDSIKDNPAIDIVYIVLPNSMHAEFTIRAAKAGKHVLCEKPMAISVDESEKMIAACKDAGKKLMIAYRLHYEPYNQAMIDITRKQQYGKLKLIEATNCQWTKAPNIRLSKQLRGGPLGDVGIYCLNATRYITGEEPSEFFAFNTQPKDDPRFAEVPESFAWTQRFPSGVIANCASSFGTGLERHLTLYFEKGVVLLENAFGYSGQRLKVIDGYNTHELHIEPVNHFTAEMDNFAQCISDGKDSRTPGEEGLIDEKHMAMIQRSADTGQLTKSTV